MLYSFSRLSLYQTCPYRFRRKYIDGIEEPVTKPLALGKAVHKAIELVIKGKTVDQAVLTGWLEADLHPDVTQMEIKELLQNAPVQPGMGETEVYFRLPLSDSLGAPELQGYMDLITGDSLVDWKTNWAMYDVLGTHQVGLYAWALQQLKKIPVVKGRLHFLRFKRSSEHLFSRADMEKARKWALHWATEIENKLFLLHVAPEEKDVLFPATPSSACSHCPFAVECYRKFGEGMAYGN
ncbi:MAG TPA: PD-(D/E)XK nuclease family protein [Bacillales bacterium]|nr:PD-(D/E)XK nuclease family protein [Bacillales bacterium]